jgi:amino acid adenylation domain-containing protein
VTFALHHLLTEASAGHPDHRAVRCGSRDLTYAHLNAAASGVARTLLDAGVQPGDRVAISLPKGVEMVAAVYGIMRAGAAYVPLDPRAPAARSAKVSADCSVSALISTPDLAGPLLSKLEAPPPRIALLVGNGTLRPEVRVRSASFAAAATSGARDPGVPVIESDLAYILYTSGSTGVPKGVMLSHRNALTFVDWCATRIGARADDRLSNHAPLHFDLSVFDLFLAAASAATVVLVPDEITYLGSELVRFVRDESITVWYSVPSALTLIARVARDPKPLAALRTIVFAGEVFPTRDLRALRALVPHAELWNLYGPTETNVCTYYRVAGLPDDDHTIPIGRACENTRVSAVRADGSKAGVGEEGELYVRGPGVMRGYWGRREMTAEVLVPDPLQPHDSDMVYRTGDIVRLRADGDYDFVGRRDHQIKSRGFRIELGEIEATLRAHPALREAVAVAIPHEAWGKAIIACVVAKDGEGVTQRDVKRHVAERLPRYMVPVGVEFLPDLPRTSTGKIDRQELLGLAEAAAIPV